jgi:GAF domain-containing protein
VDRDTGSFQADRLADEQAALRRVVTLVAQAVPPGELFRTVTDEVGTLLGADLATMVRYENDDTLTLLASWAAAGELAEVSLRGQLEEGERARPGRPARMASDDGSSARLVAIRERLGIRSSLGSPIVVEGQVRGVLDVHFKGTEPLPADTE